MLARIAYRYARLPALLHARAQLAGLILATLLQRSPAIVRVFQTVIQSLEPATRIIQRAVIAAASLGSYHALSGATNYRIGYQQPEEKLIDGTLEDQIINLDVGQALLLTVGGNIPTSGHQVDSWKLEGAPPNGIVVDGQSNATPNEEGIFNSLVANVSGTPTSPGSSTFSIQAFNDRDGGGESITPLSFTITVTGDPAEATVLSIERTGDAFVVSWPIVLDQAYQLYVSSDGITWTPDNRSVTEAANRSSVTFQASEVQTPTLLRVGTDFQ